MIVSSLAEEGAEETVAALALGAADTLPKPGTGRFNGRFSECCSASCGTRLRRRSSVPVSQVASALGRSPSKAMPLQLLAIGRRPADPCARTFFALCRTDWRSDPRHPAPATAFMTVFARQLSIAARRKRSSPRTARAASDRIVVAPGERT
jgi:two-component system chemotaxis response regulator CheB